MKSTIRSASIYRAHILQDEEAFRQALSDLRFGELSPSQSGGHGFVATDGEFLRTFHGGYGFTVRFDEKVVPPSALRAELERLVKNVEDQTGRKPGRKERKGIKDEARLNLTLKALARTVHVNCYYHVEQKLLIVASTSQKLCDMTVSLLVNALETMKTSTIHVSVRSNLTKRLQQWVDATCEGDAFGDLQPTGRANLVSVEGRNLSVKSEDLVMNIAALKEALNVGYEVKNLSLRHGGLEFLLTDKFKFGALHNTDLGDSESGEEREDYWAAGAYIEVTALVNAVNALCGMFGYGEEAEAGEGEQQ